MQIEKFGKFSSLARWSSLVSLVWLAMFSITTRAHAIGVSCPTSGSPAPAITVQPVNETADIGATGNTASFQVSACEGGTTPVSTALSFQWQYFSATTGWTNFGTGTDFSGSTNGGSGSAAGPFSSCGSSPCTSAFTTSPVTSTTLFVPASSAGLSVHVLVSDVNGVGVASNSVFLYSNSAPSVTGPTPSTLTVNAGQSTSFTVSATTGNATGALGYQWYVGGSCSAGAASGGTFD